MGRRFISFSGEAAAGLGVDGGMVSKWGLIVVILLVFVGVGAALPFLNEEFDDYGVVGVDPLLSAGGAEAPSGSTTLGVGLSSGKVLVSVLSMFFWTFGALPLWLELIFLSLIELFGGCV